MTTTYKIATINGELFVIQTFEHGHTTHQDVTHGPYKNEKSAKGRIRDLKAKEIAPIAEIKSNVAVGNEFPNGEKMIGRYLANTIPPAEKIAASSAYGKSNYNRPVGCYPHVSKHAYQR